MRVFIFILVFFSILLNAQDIAFAKSVKGEVEAKTTEKVILVKSGDWLSEEMLIITKAKSEIQLIFKDNSKLVLGANSILSLKKYLFKPEKNEFDFQLQLDRGVASFESGEIGKLSPEDFVFRTPESTIAIRGTKFMVKVQ